MKNEEKRDKIIFIDYAPDIYLEDLTSNLKLDIDRDQRDTVSSTPSISMAKIINAISRSMTCDICPYPCGAKKKSSIANCNSHWIEILSNMEIKDREEVRDEVFKLFYKDSFGFN